MQKRATPPHFTRRLNIPRLWATRSSEASVSTPRDVATSRACSRTSAALGPTASLGELQRLEQLPPLFSSSLLSPSLAGAARPPGDPPVISMPSPVARRSSSMAAASCRSALMRSRSSLSSASRAPELGMSEAVVASCAVSRSRSRAARAWTSSSGSSTSPPSARRAAAAASEPLHEACSSCQRLASELEVSPRESRAGLAGLAGLAGASEMASSTGSAREAPVGEVHVPATSAATASLTASSPQRGIRSLKSFANRPSTALCTSGATWSGSGWCAFSQMQRTRASWLLALNGRCKVATS
mmetsp:Transcript_45976/g.142389  ORF Transcript_45976/g.142389 Transcript_45976/m.142389 type:complete len:300 (-) Transcript_45976:252-1151(-)